MSHSSNIKSDVCNAHIIEIEIHYFFLFDVVKKYLTELREKDRVNFLSRQLNEWRDVFELSLLVYSLKSVKNGENVRYVYICIMYACEYSKYSRGIRSHITLVVWQGKKWIGKGQYKKIEKER